jgi:hypothetical protein
MLNWSFLCLSHLFHRQEKKLHVPLGSSNYVMLLPLSMQRSIRSGYPRDEASLSQLLLLPNYSYSDTDVWYISTSTPTLIFSLHGFSSNILRSWLPRPFVHLSIFPLIGSLYLMFYLLSVGVCHAIEGDLLACCHQPSSASRNCDWMAYLATYGVLCIS